MVFQIFFFFFALLNCIHYTPPKGQETSMESFQGWMSFFNKTYIIPSEVPYRYQNFVRTWAKVVKLNALKTTATFGLTKFADMSDMEFKQRILMRPPAGPVKQRTPLTQLAAPNKPIDWVAAGKTTPVKNQEQCGSCWAFSATESIESANIITGALKNPTSESSWLAPQEIVDCDSAMSGCGGGWPFQAMGWVITQKGLDTESSYPYTGSQGTCASSSGTVGANIKSYANISGDENTLYTALSTPSIGPLSICCDASQWSSYSGGLFPTSECSSDPANIDHAIQLTGYNPSGGLASPYWIVRNSWGADWGENGFIYLPFGQDPCAITSYVAYATGMPGAQ